MCAPEEDDASAAAADAAAATREDDDARRDAVRRVMLMRTRDRDARRNDATDAAPVAGIAEDARHRRRRDALP
jgi:hypothetical protein